jgi:hypothetical protein
MISQPDQLHVQDPLFRHKFVLTVPKKDDSNFYPISFNCFFH